MVTGAWISARYFSAQLRRVVEEASATDSEELRGVLEEQMVTGQRAALVRLVKDIGRAPGVVWVSVIDGQGTIRFSSDPRSVGANLPPVSIGLDQLRSHHLDGGRHSETIVRDGCSVLRTVTPLVNEESCAACHGPGLKLNGALIVDRSLVPLQQVEASTTARVAIGTATALLVLLATLGLAVERTVLQRLQRLIHATRRLGAGDLMARADDGGEDEVGDLARELNGMAAGLESAVIALAAERRQLDEIVNGISDGVVLLDTSLTVLAANRACLARFPAGSRPGPGWSYAELFRAAGADLPEGQVLPAARALASGEIEKAVVAVQGPHGERFEEIYAQALRDPDGRPMSVIEVWRDVTERRAIEAGLEQSERLAAIGVLASSTAHEVGNPLASIVTAVDGLLARLDEHPDAPPPPEMREYLEIVRRQVFRCRAVTEKLLGLARTPAVAVGPVDVAAVAQEVLALIGPQARAQRVEIRTSFTSGAPVLAADPLLQQVFLNLALNALRAMPHGGLLRVETRREAGGTAVVFADSGDGIPEDIRRHLFEPFQRARRDGTGSGLGLYISHTLVARCGGSIEVQSVPGQGATFTVRLRAAKGGPGAVRPAEATG